METWEYFHNRVETFLTYLPYRTLNASIDVVTDIIVYDMASPYTARDYQYALTSWLQGRHDVRQDRINEHTPHTQSDLVEYSYRFAINETLIGNELKRRSNDNGEQ